MLIGLAQYLYDFLVFKQRDLIRLIDLYNHSPYSFPFEYYEKLISFLSETVQVLLLTEKVQTQALHKLVTGFFREHFKNLNTQ